MLRTRLWMGALLIALAVGALVVDQWLAPWYPFLLLLVLGLGLAACHELLNLLGPERRPTPWLAYAAVALLVVANWPPHLLTPERIYDPPSSTGLHPAYYVHVVQSWTPANWLIAVLAAVALTAFLVEMMTFREPGHSVERIALAVWIAVYLGLLPSFLVQLRWLDDETYGDAAAGTWALALAIFVPKTCDIGAYFTGRLLGRHPMTPVLSPKKTWEGAAGGLILAALVAVAIGWQRPRLFDDSVVSMIGFGVVVGLAGMLGDLAESLLKRDCRQKDASHVVPGFGGVLDVVDAIIFAAPVAYAWLR